MPDEQVPSIRLDHFLQVCGVETGGQAKRLIQSGLVLVNDEVEMRRRKKLVSGDVVSIDGEEFEVRADSPDELHDDDLNEDVLGKELPNDAS